MKSKTRIISMILLFIILIIAVKNVQAGLSYNQPICGAELTDSAGGKYQNCTFSIYISDKPMDLAKVTLNFTLNNVTIDRKSVV